jgi:hypothetical protein
VCAGAQLAGQEAAGSVMVVQRPDQPAPRLATATASDRGSPIPKALSTPARAPMTTISVEVDVAWDKETRDAPSLPRAPADETLELRPWRRVPGDPWGRVRRWLSEDLSEPK